MNTVDIILIVLIAAAVIAAVVFRIRSAKRGKTCCGDCSQCCSQKCRKQ